MRRSGHPISQSQTFATNPTSPKTIVEQVCNDDDAMKKFEKGFQTRE
jgi:hypothetical protein